MLMTNSKRVVTIIIIIIIIHWIVIALFLMLKDTLHKIRNRNSTIATILLLEFRKLVLCYYCMFLLVGVWC